MADKTQMAKDRTDWAEDRTVLANERTFAGWMRTGLAAVAVALGLRAVFQAFEPTWVPKAVASIFVAAAVFIFYSAERQASETLQRLDDHAATARSSGAMRLTALAFGLGAILTGGVLWLL